MSVAGRPGRLLEAALLAAALVIPLTGADLYLGSSWTGIVPVEATLLSFALLLALWAYCLLRSSFADGGRLFVRAYSGSAPVLAAMGFLVLASLASTFLAGAYWGDSQRYVLFPFYNFLLLAFAVAALAHPFVRHRLNAIFSLALMLSAATILIDSAYPGTFSTFANRSAGFVQNANLGARAVTLMLIGALDWRRFRWFDLFQIAVAATAVFLTLSRSGLALFALVFLIYSGFMLRSGSAAERRRYLLFLAAAAIAVMIAAPVLISHLSHQEIFQTAVRNRLSFLGNLLSGDLSGVGDDPRAKLVPFYIDLIGQAPLLGHGAAFSRTQYQSAHNIYLEQWVNGGLLGLVSTLLLFVALLAQATRHGDRRGMVLALFCMGSGFVTHTMLYDRPYILTMALVAAASGMQRPLPARLLRRPAVGLSVPA